ncbi:spore germination protein GerPC [Aquibacillus albus]|uniref:Spore germination protein PC n=1 Tax=Aquibacillus albus TaxID=1168171 RepID=A0ABS2N033_9BACI|nr:spore germination protein GerPC [Aquibacillus albus]MBM7571496.1 spore germination protein PC [Aquibacillus albus]
MDYSNSWYEYMRQMQEYMQQQENRVRDLENRLSKIENNESSKNHTTIEKIEYHFDQLKIERLDGSLHIGLSPEDLGKIDDMSLNHLPKHPIQQQKPPPSQQLMEQLDQYVTRECPKIIQQLANEFAYPVNQSYEQLLLNDVRKQLPDRIAYYEKNINNQESRNSFNYIYEQVKKEIEYSLRQFFENERKKENNE